MCNENVQEKVFLVDLVFCHTVIDLFKPVLLFWMPMKISPLHDVEIISDSSRSQRITKWFLFLRSHRERSPCPSNDRWGPSWGWSECTVDRIPLPLDRGSKLRSHQPPRRVVESGIERKYHTEWNRTAWFACVQHSGVLNLGLQELFRLDWNPRRPRFSI